MRLVMMGSGPFAVPTLRALARSRHEVALVVTRPAKAPPGRRPPKLPMQEAAGALGLPQYAPPNINAPEAQQRLAALRPDLLVVCDYGQILKPATLATARLGGINLHGSLLPAYRGAAPVAWAIYDGRTRSGVTVIQMTPALDAGPALARAEVDIDPDETAGELEHRLAEIGAPLVVQVVDALEAGTAAPLAQDDSQATRAPRLTKAQGQIDFTRSAAEVKNQIRAMQPWPTAYAYLWIPPQEQPLRVQIHQTQPAAWPAECGQPAPGAVCEVAGRLFVACGTGALEIQRLQPAGKRPMSAAEFLRGHRLPAGSRFAGEC